MQEDNTDAVLETLSPLLDGASFGRRSKLQVLFLREFLGSLTDPAAEDLAHLVPASVPSGLPVED